MIGWSRHPRLSTAFGTVSFLIAPVHRIPRRQPNPCREVLVCLFSEVHQVSSCGFSLLFSPTSASWPRLVCPRWLICRIGNQVTTRGGKCQGETGRREVLPLAERAEIAEEKKGLLPPVAGKLGVLVVKSCRRCGGPCRFWRESRPPFLPSVARPPCRRLGVAFGNIHGRVTNSGRKARGPAPRSSSSVFLRVLRGAEPCYFAELVDRWSSVAGRPDGAATDGGRRRSRGTRLAPSPRLRRTKDVGEDA